MTIGIADALLVVFLLGPRVEIDQWIARLEIPEDVASYIDSSESQFDDLIPGTEAKIVWRKGRQEKTALSVVFIHGFSASRKELAPLCDSLAAALKANLFYSRLTGHGRTSRALADASVNDWLNDMVKAVDVGRRIGDGIVLVGSSTGATLIYWFLGTQDADDIVAVVLLSPNFGPRDSRARVLLWPWGRQIAEAIAGNARSWVPHNDVQRRFWTTSYPTRALVPMMGLVQLADNLDPAAITTPLLMLFSERDSVVDGDQTKRKFNAIASDPKRLVETSTDDPAGHILGGDIVSPGTTQGLSETILSFLAVVLIDPTWKLANY